jgi:outer membrane protein
MTSFLRKVLCGLVLLTLVGSPAFGQARIGTINLRKAFDNYWKRKEAEAALREREQEMAKELESRLKEFNSSKEEYQKLLTASYDQSLSADERDKRKRSAEDKLKSLKEMEDDLKKLDRSASQDRDERRKRVRDNLLANISDIVTAKAKAAGYTMVIDTEAETPNGTKVILYSTMENDLTDEVLKQLNTGAPADTGKPEEKKPEPAKDDKKKTSTKK